MTQALPLPLPHPEKPFPLDALKKRVEEIERVDGTMPPEEEARWRKELGLDRFPMER